MTSNRIAASLATPSTAERSVAIPFFSRSAPINTAMRSFGPPPGCDLSDSTTGRFAESCRIRNTHTIGNDNSAVAKVREHHQSALLEVLVDAKDPTRSFERPPNSSETLDMKDVQANIIAADPYKVGHSKRRCYKAREEPGIQQVERQHNIGSKANCLPNHLVARAAPKYCTKLFGERYRSQIRMAKEERTQAANADTTFNGTNSVVAADQRPVVVKSQYLHAMARFYKSFCHTS
jgi:hypothetical protein